ncbi:MAG: glycosyltransferase family A protein [Bacteroidales bacterium]|nr:glycosyltransferase family A protein [Bacteroidales bacterium]
MDYKYNFSFIIPHKNIPELLRRCVSSIPRRNDVQIIVVDDNSDPEFVDFEHFPFLGAPNIKVIFDKSGLRAGHARNIGLQYVEGKWILFADSDDFFFYSINKAMDDCLRSDADIIYYRSTNLDSNTYKADTTRSGVTNTSIDMYLNHKAFGEDYVRYRHPAPWGKFIRSSMIQSNNIVFAEVIKANDALFSIQCGFYAKKIEVHDISLYCLTTREGNVTSVFSPEALYAVATTETDLMRFMIDRNINNTPVFTIWENDVFASLLGLKESHDELYKKACRYIKVRGFTEQYIAKRLEYIANGRKKAKIVSAVRKLLHI